MADRVKVSMDGGVADVRLSRPDKMNALDGAMYEALIEAGDRLKQDRAVRAVVLSGEGEAFCAGLDGHTLQMLMGPNPGEGGPLHSPFATAHEQRPYGIANRVQYAVWVWHIMPVPVIAAVHGAAIGSGFELALGADIRIVAPDTRMAIIELDWGMVPDMCGTHLMTRLAADEAMRELLFTGRTFTGEEAVNMGLASRTAVDPRREALKLAAEIAAKSPDAVRAAKRLLNIARDADAEHLLMRETAEQVALFGAPNQVEAYKAHMAGRPARFIDAKS
ncbi:MAG TPA: crotonase/enoyl-CoA hydratase family protein [Caulobacteraceae bacterium]|nr:crotonase/enoyl-CoA hydratase family protein [Caulobacteraceae bacterium]